RWRIREKEFCGSISSRFLRSSTVFRARQVAAPVWDYPSPKKSSKRTAARSAWRAKSGVAVRFGSPCRWRRQQSGVKHRRFLMAQPHASSLIVDDERNIRKNLQMLLKAEGYHVDVASDGEEALAECRERHYDVALVDIQMPKMGGLALLRYL